MQVVASSVRIVKDRILGRAKKFSFSLAFLYKSCLINTFLEPDQTRFRFLYPTHNLQNLNLCRITSPARHLWPSASCLNLPSCQREYLCEQLDTQNMTLSLMNLLFLSLSILSSTRRSLRPLLRSSSGSWVTPTCHLLPLRPPSQNCTDSWARTRAGPDAAAWPWPVMCTAVNFLEFKMSWSADFIVQMNSKRR